MLGDFNDNKQKRMVAWTTVVNDGGVSAQILSILLVIEPSGFTNELYVDHERKMSDGWHQNFLEDEIPFGGRIPHFRRPVLNGFIISFFKKHIPHLGRN